jgi:hypothetical protein
MDSIHTFWIVSVDTCSVFRVLCSVFYTDVSTSTSHLYILQMIYVIYYHAIRRYVIIQSSALEEVSFSAKVVEGAISYHPTGCLPL